jgi:hypothetical protein
MECTTSIDLGPKDNRAERVRLELRIADWSDLSPIAFMDGNGLMLPAPVMLSLEEFVISTYFLMEDG